MPVFSIIGLCEACGRRHVFGLPAEPAADGYWYICPESAELVTIPSDLRGDLNGEEVEHDGPGVVPLFRQHDHVGRGD